MKRFRVGDRIVVTSDSNWPERVGCHGVVVTGDPNIYPVAGLGKTEALILLDDDPIVSRRDLWWTCAISEKALQPEAQGVLA